MPVAPINDACARMNPEGWQRLNHPPDGGASLRSIVLGALSPRLGLTARGAAPPDDYAAATSSASSTVSSLFKYLTAKLCY